MILLHGAVRLAALHRLVLVAHALLPQLEDVGQVLRLLLTAAATAAATLLSHRDTHVAELGFGALELLQGAQLGLESRLHAILAQHRLGRVHRRRGQRQNLRDARQRRVGLGNAALDEVGLKLLNVLP